MIRVTYSRFFLAFGEDGGDEKINLKHEILNKFGIQMLKRRPPNKFGG